MLQLKIMTCDERNLPIEVKCLIKILAPTSRRSIKHRRVRSFTTQRHRNPGWADFAGSREM